MTTASDYQKVQRAIEIFTSYGHGTKLLTNFSVNGVGEFRTADEFFTAATMYDLGRSHGFMDGVREMEEESEWKDCIPSNDLPCHPYDRIHVKYSDGGTTENVMKYAVYAHQFKYNFSLKDPDSPGRIVSYKIVERYKGEE